MKRIIATMNIETIDLELISFDQRTLFSSFKVIFNSVTKTELILSGKVIEELYRNAKYLINEVPIDKEAFKDSINKVTED